MAYGKKSQTETLDLYSSGPVELGNRPSGARAGYGLHRRQFLYGLPLAFGTTVLGTVASHAAGHTAEPLAAVRTIAQYRDARARLAKRWTATLVDIGAEWCAFCQTIDRKILPDPQVIALLAHVGFIKVDVTAMDQGNRDLLRALRADGPPTIFVIETASGREYANTRSVGSFPVESLIERLQPFAQ